MGPGDLIDDSLHLRQQRMVERLGNTFFPAEMVVDGADAYASFPLYVVDGRVEVTVSGEQAKGSVQDVLTHVPGAGIVVGSNGHGKLTLE
jgi:hypothetical protein